MDPSPVQEGAVLGAAIGDEGSTVSPPTNLGVEARNGGVFDHDVVSGVTADSDLSARRKNEDLRSAREDHGMSLAGSLGGERNTHAGENSTCRTEVAGALSHFGIERLGGPPPLLPRIETFVPGIAESN